MQVFKVCTHMSTFPVLSKGSFTFEVSQFTVGIFFV
jgi:hypothetical protein